MNSRVDIQVRYPQGWKTICTVESLQQHIFLEFVTSEWSHLDVRVVSEKEGVWRELNKKTVRGLQFS